MKEEENVNLVDGWIDKNGIAHPRGIMMSAPTLLVVPDEAHRQIEHATRCSKCDGLGYSDAMWPRIVDCRHCYDGSGRVTLPSFSFPHPTQPTKPGIVGIGSPPIGVGIFAIPLVAGDPIVLATTCRYCGGTRVINGGGCECGYCDETGVVPFAEATYTGAEPQKRQRWENGDLVVTLSEGPRKGQPSWVIAYSEETPERWLVTVADLQVRSER